MIAGLYLRAALALTVIALLFGAGWYGRGIFDVKKEVKVLQQDKHETNQNIEHAVQESVKVDSDIQVDHGRIDDIRTQVAARMAKPTYKEQPHDNPVHDSLPQAPDAMVSESALSVRNPVLDAGTVRLLNAARSGAELRAAGRGDDQEPGPAATAR